MDSDPEPPSRRALLAGLASAAAGAAVPVTEAADADAPRDGGRGTNREPRVSVTRYGYAATRIRIVGDGDT